MKNFTDNQAEALIVAKMAEQKSFVARFSHKLPRKPVYEMTRDLLMQDEIGELVFLKLLACF